MTDEPSGSAETVLSPPSNGQPSPSPLDELFDALADWRRRCVLRCLQASDRPTALADVAAEVAARTSDSASAEVSEETVERVYASLYHVHVPKLADVGVVDYDRDRATVALTDDADRARPFLEAADA